MVTLGVIHWGGYDSLNYERISIASVMLLLRTEFESSTSGEEKLHLDENSLQSRITWGNMD